MQQSFDALLDSFIDKQVGVADSFLSAELAADLKQNLLSLCAGERLQPAGIGNGKAHALNTSVRGDRILWLDRSNNDPVENRFFDLMDAFVLHLNTTCYTGITGYEFHYTLYEEGRYYKKHIDQFRSDQSRKFSMIIYLNPDWQEGDGGELCIYHQDESLQYIAPMNGKTVFFKSNELAHEVLMTKKPRMSITGWLKTMDR